MKQVILSVLLALALSSAPMFRVTAQEKPAQPLTEEQQKQKEENEKLAFALIEQIANEAQFLKLPENRIRMQFGLADLLWAQNAERARSMFSLAADGVAELMRASEPADRERRGPGAVRSGMQLRQELVLTAARHDAPLAYQLLAATKPASTTVANPNDPTATRRMELEDMLEQSLLSQIAALDPKFALQQAEQLLDKGELTRSLADVLRQLQTKDKEGAAKLEDRIVKKLQTANMLATNDVGGLAMSLLQPGPRTAGAALASTTTAPQPLLSASAYQDLLGAVIDAAMKATPQAATAQRRPTNPGRGRGANATAPANTARNNNQQQRPTDAQLEQANARRLLNGLVVLLPQVDQYAPSKASALRQKMSEQGVSENRRGQMAQFAGIMQQGGSSETLLAAASAAPPAMQSRIYRQAALRALDEGNSDRAKQIANDHLDPRSRDALLQTVQFRELAKKADGTGIEEVRQLLSGLSSDAERINALLQMSESARKNNPELALQLVDQAREYTNRRATSYQQFEQQVRISAAYSVLGSTQAFDVLEPGIMHLNELLSAAAVLSGFEVNVFRDGEMPLQGGSALNDTVRRFAQQIGSLAKTDYDRAQALANRFQNAEPRVIARLAMAQVLLGKELPTNNRNNRRFGGPITFSN